MEFECGYNGEHGQEDSNENPVGPVVGYAFFRDKEYDDVKIRENETEAWKYRAENDESAQLLEQLKLDTKKWAERGRGGFYTYGTPQQFYTKAHEKLKELLAVVIPKQIDSLEFTQEAHWRKLTVGYASVKELDAHIRAYILGSVSRPCVVTSAPGGGKSALLASTIQWFRKEYSTSGSCCIYHFAGASNTSQNLEDLLENLKRQVVHALELRPADSQNFSKQYEMIPIDERLAWLVDEWDKKKPRSKLLVVIDGLNELSNEQSGDGRQHSHDLVWLLRRCDDQPQPWPSNVRVIISTLGECDQYKSGRCLQVVETNKGEFFMPILKIDKVGPKQCEDMIMSILRNSRKEIDASFNLKDELTSHEGRANPLFITIFINELKFFSGYKLADGAFEQLGDFVEELLQAEDVSSLLDVVLSRLERVHCLPIPTAPELGLNDALGQLKQPPLLVEKTETRVTYFSKSSPGLANTVVRQVVLVKPLRTVETGSMVLLPKESRISRVVQVNSKSEFKVMDHGESPVLQLLSEDNNVYQLTDSLVSKVMKFIWASMTGLKLSEILDLVNKTLIVPGVNPQRFRVTQEQLVPLLASLHRLLSRNGGLFNMDHEVVHRAVESRYLAFSKGRIRTLDVRRGVVAEENKKGIHKVMAQYFKKASRIDDESDLQVLPRAIREKNHHETLSGDRPSFRVIARVRPFIARERGESSVFVRVDRLQMCAEDPRTKQPRVFSMDCCVSGMENQQTMWRRIGGNDLVEKALTGTNLTVLAYGQTGSGKTYTMFGKPGKENDPCLKQSFDPTDKGSGLIPRIITGLFEGLNRIKATERGFKSSITLSVLEIHNEQVKDLMNADTQAILTIRGSRAQNLSIKEIFSTVDAMSIVQEAYSKRVTNCTAMNDQSSRSHCVIILRVEQTYEDGASRFKVHSLVNLVDLAGSERGRTRKFTERKLRDAKLPCEGEYASDLDKFQALEDEAIFINKSLLVLNQVISNLAKAKKGSKIFAPFRESKLTQLLEESLHGNTFTTMVVTVSPSPTDYGETLNSLEYAGAAKRIRNKVTQNAEDVMIQEVVEGSFRLDNGSEGLEERVRRHAPRMRILKVTNEDIHLLPASLELLVNLLQVGELRKLETITFEGCDCLLELPAEIAKLTTLRTLNLRECSMLTSLPAELRALTRLQLLDLGGCTSLMGLPAGLGVLIGLQELDLHRCTGLTALPTEIGALSGLQKLDLSYCGALTALPAGLSALTNLQTLCGAGPWAGARRWWSTSTTRRGTACTGRRTGSSCRTARSSFTWRAATLAPRTTRPSRRRSPGRSRRCSSGPRPCSRRRPAPSWAS